MNNKQPIIDVQDLKIPQAKVALDLNTIFGLILTFGLIAGAIMINDSDANFFNIPSFLIVILGTITVTAISFSWDEFSKAGRVIQNSLFQKKQSAKEKAFLLMDIAVISKKNGLLALGNIEQRFEKDPFMIKALQIVGDGYPPEKVHSILSNEIDSFIQRRKHAASILKRGSEVAPAMGLIGTLIGLVQMLANLESPETIGPAMAVALLTTFYGAILGTTVLAPMAAKLERNLNEDVLHFTLVILAMASIASQENPRQLETLLNSELPANDKIDYFE